MRTVMKMKSQKILVKMYPPFLLPIISLQNPYSIYESALKERDGGLNFDRAESLVHRYRRSRPTEDIDPSEKPLAQFSSRAIQISRGLYLKADTPVGGNIDPRLNEYVESSSENEEDAEVMEYLGTLNEEDRELLMKKLEEKPSTHSSKRRKRHSHDHHHSSKHHRHHHRSHSHNYFCLLTNTLICYCNDASPSIQ